MLIISTLGVSKFAHILPLLILTRAMLGDGANTDIRIRKKAEAPHTGSLGSSGVIKDLYPT